jgi:hypothetical protein
VTQARSGRPGSARSCGDCRDDRAEQSLAENTRFSSVQQMSVAIVHPATAASDSHMEDVVDFRRGPNQRFSKHIT